MPTYARPATLLSLIPTAAFLYFLSLIPKVADGEVIDSSIDWVPALEIALSFRIDGLSLLFALLITGIGSLVVIYAATYIDRDAARGQFFTFLLLFMGAMLGLVLADDLIALFVFWELTSVTSFVLIGFQHNETVARNAARQALLVTGGGGLAMLAGLVLLSGVSGESTLSGLTTPGVLTATDPLVVAAFLLVALGALTKSAQMPFHFWLPSAMAAPTPISAYLHSATMVKAGIYLLARLQPALGEVSLWTPLLSTIGGVTMVVAALLALREHDLKRVLAYSTISALGALVFLIGLAEPAALKAAMVFLVGHALYKAALFLVAGAIDHEAGTRDLRLLGGLRRAMPFTATAAVIAAVSMSGLPPTLGFLGKEAVFAATTKSAIVAELLSGSFLVTAMLLLALGVLVGLRPFLGTSPTPPKIMHEAPPALWGPPLLLAVLGVVGGIASPWLAEPLLEPAVTSTVGEPQSIKLTLWPGVGPVFWLSAVSIGGGILAALAVGHLRRVVGDIRLPEAASVYEVGLEGLNTLARAQTQALQSGHLSRYVMFSTTTVILLIAVQLVVRDVATWPDLWTDVRLVELAVAALVLGAGMASAMVRSRLRAVLTLGAAGYGVALIYVLFGAPDLAMTQVLVETLAVILLVAVFRHLPATAPRSSNRVRAQHAAIAAAGGLTMTMLTWSVLAARRGHGVSEFFLQSSKSLAEGRNVVNTIIVDFRALDTLGEIAVLAVAAIGVTALLRLRPRGEESRS